ncbi:MAG: mechanosensitive ion channel [Bacteroidales bacterium]|nr:mechanosensitive ion channel [Bacteroidales bacterium]
MHTNQFAQSLLGGIKDALSWIGIPRHMLDKFDEIIFLIVIIIIAFALAGIIHSISVRFAKRILKRKNVPILSSIIENSVLRKLTAIIPPLIISALLPFAFNSKSEWYTISEKITWIYFFVALIFSVNAILRTVGDTLKNKQELQNRPMKGFIQIFQVIFSCLIVIVIISILINKSPFNLITGLGAFAAVLMLVFKDTILGFVAGVLISENDVVRIGDWIEVPQSNINGIVVDISLNFVKVQNFDNTFVTIPPYSLVSGSFTNWRGMSDSGGRRIMREYVLKLDYIKPCSPEFLEKMKAFDEELAQFITEKQQQAAEGKVANTENPAGLTNGTIETNAGLLRAYMNMYLKRHPFISKDLLLMVRTLAPTANGLPLQIYCFSTNKNWPSYESIQADIMEHFVSILPAFELYPFQSSSARDTIISSLIESGKIDLSIIDGMPWHSVLLKENKDSTSTPLQDATPTSQSMPAQ